MGLDRGKKQKLEKFDEENIGSEHIDAELVLSIEKLQEVQDELEKINEEASEKVLEVERKYNEIRKPVYDQRNEVIKSIPDFWVTAFINHTGLSELFSEKDQKIFSYLTNLEVEEFKDMKIGFSITLTFDPNPYFDDTKLTKTFTFLEEGHTKITATSIKWKEDKGNITNAGENKGNKRSHDEERLKSLYLYRRIGDESFFTWFGETELQIDMAEIHDEVAIFIKDDLWPNPLKYFNNEDSEEEFEVDDDEDDEEEGSDEEGV